MRSHRAKAERQVMLSKYLEDNPFLTDDDLAKVLDVSIQTIRLYRTELGIPELRERLKKIARNPVNGSNALKTGKLTGELIELQVGKSGMSLLVIDKSMTLENSNVARGHYLFDQANSLAVALIDSDVALTATSKVSFRRPVYCGEKVVAEAMVRRGRRNRFMVRVISRVQQEVVFEGKFLTLAIV